MQNNKTGSTAGMNNTVANQRSQQIINKLKIAIQKYNINLVELFNKYDKRESHTLDQQELGVMLRFI
jgi:hypothetical protein